jgi:hypothetical protein
MTIHIIIPPVLSLGIDCFAAFQSQTAARTLTFRLILEHFNSFGNTCSLVNYFTQDLDHLS